MQKKRWWLIGLAAVVIVGLGYAGFGAAQGASERRAIADAPEETAIVERGTLRVVIDGSGSLAPQDEVSLAFLSGGTVVEVCVEVGDGVAAGDVLARLDDADARQVVEEAELAVAQAELSLVLARAEAEAGLAQANLDAAQAAHDRAAAVGARTGDKLTSARVNLAQARDNLADAQDNYDQAWDEARDWELDIRGRKDALEAEREATEKALATAQYNLEIAQANYNLAVAEISDSDVQSAWTSVLNARLALEREPLELEQLELSLAEARLRLASARRALVEMTLTAPLDGTVTALELNVGEMVAGGAPVVVLSDLGTFVVEVSLDETDVARVSVGQEAVVTLDAFPGETLSGKVTAIAPVAASLSGVVLYPVTIRLAAAAAPARAGMTADVEIVAASQADVLIVPLRAIWSEDGASYVWRQAAGGFERVEVTLGVMTETEVEIVAGLSEGDVVSVVAAPQSNGRPTGFGPMGRFGGGNDD